jgi:hypothetical protein
MQEKFLNIALYIAYIYLYKRLEFLYLSIFRRVGFKYIGFKILSLGMCGITNT